VFQQQSSIEAHKLSSESLQLASQSIKRKISRSQVR